MEDEPLQNDILSLLEESGVAEGAFLSFDEVTAFEENVNFFDILSPTTPANATVTNTEVASLSTEQEAEVLQTGENEEKSLEKPIKECTVLLTRLSETEIEANLLKAKNIRSEERNDKNNNINATTVVGRKKSLDCLPPPPPVSMSNGATRQRSLGGGGKNVCVFCGKNFPQFKLLESHMNVHTKERPYPCPHCDESFSYPAVLWVHERRHLGKLYICEFCNKSYTAPTNLSAHKKAHHQNQIPPVPDTSKVQQVSPPPPPPPIRSKNKESNGKRPPKKKKKIEPEAIETIVSPDSSKSASPNKQPNKTFTCQSCPQTFTTKRRLKLHVTMEHSATTTMTSTSAITTTQLTPINKILPPPPPDFFRCEQCAQDFSSDNEMKRHMCTYNNDESRPQLWQSYTVEPPDIKFHTMVNPLESYLTADDRQFFDMICNL